VPINALGPTSKRTLYPHSHDPKHVFFIPSEQPLSS
jgi:hypothetical protein